MNNTLLNNTNKFSMDKNLNSPNKYKNKNWVNSNKVKITANNTINNNNNAFKKKLLNNNKNYNNKNNKFNNLKYQLTLLNNKALHNYSKNIDDNKTLKKKIKKLSVYFYGKFSYNGKKRYYKRKNWKSRKYFIKKKIQDLKFKNTVVIHIVCSANNTFLVSLRKRVLLTSINKKMLMKKYRLKIKSARFWNRFKKRWEQWNVYKTRQWKEWNKTKKGPEPKVKKILTINKNRVLLNLFKQFVVTHVVSTGMTGFTGTKRGLPYAAQVAGTTMGIRLRKKFKNLKGVFINIKGYGKGRINAIKGLRIGLGRKIPILSLKNINPQAHNGCKHKKKRRI